MQYFDAKLNLCRDKFAIDYTWKYGNRANIIILTFNDLNARTKTAIFNESLFSIKIDDFEIEKNYTYKFSNNSNEITILFNYKSNLIGGKFLHISYDESLYLLLNSTNKTAYILNRKYDIKLFEYYLLSENEVNMIEISTLSAKIRFFGSKIAFYLRTFLNPSTSFALR